jgi:hypothetical protein
MDSSPPANRQALGDISNRFPASPDFEKDWYPIIPINDYDLPVREPLIPQNFHPLLPLYKHDLKTGELSHDALSKMLSDEDETNMLDFLVSMGVLAYEQQCEFCGGAMKRVKDGKNWFWRCSRRVDGVKCNRGKKSIHDGTFLDNSHLSIQAIIWIVWHFVHKLSENQYKQYTNMGQKSETTVVTWYRFCREMCTEWFWKPESTPKQRGFRQIVKMDGSFF